MPTTIKLRNSVTTTSAPSSLVQGEVAINITDKKVWVGNAATTPIQLLGDGGSASFTSIAFGAGTVSSPSITFTGDPNTGIYSPAADTIAFAEGGVEGLRINSNGQTSTSIAGTASLPSFTRTGDENTGIFFPAADTIAFTEGGVESMRIDSSGNVGIGTTSPQTKLHVSNGTIRNSGTNGVMQLIDGNTANGVKIAAYNAAFNANGYLAFEGQSIEYARFDSSGNFGIGTSSPSSFGKFAVTGSVGSFYVDVGATGVAFSFNGANYISAKGGGSGALVFETGGANERMRITSGGDLGIGTSAPTSKITISNGNGWGHFNFSNTAENGSAPWIAAFNDATVSSATFGWAFYDSSSDGNLKLYRRNGSTTGNLVMTWARGSGDVTVAGALSKGSGSFRIDHPLPQLSETHQLVHSFVEAPQADLIYRGKATLQNGKAIVNIDESAGMTDGTFVALCREVQCFTSNESDWDAVRGSVNGNLLTIECQNNQSTATISWLVIGERQDKHMYETSWTDENGKVIVEPLK